ncbi:taste receptor type 2 member 39-like [Hyperolius riggenbachi]|uniref:taste receptor type 2 member 39-like n=1 Tax=Hyperolius riggenbachi TaxID=752182 RepID=UPI0035A292B0
MDFFLHKILPLALLAECFVGVAVNVFIAAVQIIKWKAVRSLDSRDQILLCLGISRSLALMVVFLIFFVLAYFTEAFQNFIFSSAAWTLAWLAHYTNLWSTTILCVFYCVKIATYNNPVFIYMKTRISRLVPQLILAFFLVSIVSSLSEICRRILFHQQNSVTNSSLNITMVNVVVEQVFFVNFTFFVMDTFLPFVVFCVAISLLIYSLWQHVRQMRGSGTGFRNTSLQAHLSVVKNMTLFLLLQVIYFGCCLIFMSRLVPQASHWMVIFEMITCGPLCLHSAHLIYSNAKLSEAFSRMWHGLIRCT